MKQPLNKRLERLENYFQIGARPKVCLLINDEMPSDAVDQKIATWRSGAPDRDFVLFTGGSREDTEVALIRFVSSKHRK